MKKNNGWKSSRLTQRIYSFILSFMSTKNITPETYKDISQKELEARQARDEKIRQQRAGDPDYWTLERLAKHWGISKQMVDYIVKGDPRKK